MFENLRHRKYLNLLEEIPVGKTVETPLFRIHRYVNSLNVTDLKNAGKRGKWSNRFVLNDLDYRLDKTTEKVLSQFSSSVHKAKSYTQARSMAQKVVDQNKKTGKGVVKIYDDQSKSIDVAPYGKKEVTIDNSDMFLTSELNSFIIGDKRDKNNAPRTMEPTRGGKTMAKKFRVWVVKNRATIEKMDYSEVLTAMNKAGITGYSWCAMD